MKGYINGKRFIVLTLDGKNGILKSFLFLSKNSSLGAPIVLTLGKKEE